VTITVPMSRLRQQASAAAAAGLERLARRLRRLRDLARDPGVAEAQHRVLVADHVIPHTDEHPQAKSSGGVDVWMNGWMEEEAGQ